MDDKYKNESCYKQQLTDPSLEVERNLSNTHVLGLLELVL
jgi:hypothetical protein